MNSKIKKYFYDAPNFKKFFILFLVTFLIRGSVFYFYIQHEERYHQADSMDYHAGALFIALGHGMYNPQADRPIFWRTPGYPAYLAAFYNFFGITDANFEGNAKAQKASIWVQIILSSFLPILIFYLALILLDSLFIAWASAWISVFHIGFILSSTYILTEGLATIFFVAYLICFFSALRTSHPSILSFSLFQSSKEHSGRAIKEQNHGHDPARTECTSQPYGKTGVSKYSGTNNLRCLISAAIVLAIYTWIRPMGQTLAIVSIVLLLFSAGNTGKLKNSWKKRVSNSAIFFTIFFLLISPWYIRNHNLTGQYFFFPVFGPYLTCFCAPKIHAKVNNLELAESHKILTRLGGHFTYQAMLENQNSNSPYYICPEIACLPAAMPLIKEHPFLFARDWIVEVCKTTFDLYSSQLVAFATNCYKFDALIEYLDEKIKACIYSQPLPIWMRIIAWLELIFSILLWIGIFFGILLFMLVPLFTGKLKKPENWDTATIWLQTGIIFIASVIVTGGFGYARLRLPVEPLIIIMSLSFWRYIYSKLQNRKLIKS